MLLQPLSNLSKTENELQPNSDQIELSSELDKLNWSL